MYIGILTFIWFYIILIVTFLVTINEVLGGGGEGLKLLRVSTCIWTLLKVGTMWELIK